MIYQEPVLSVRLNCKSRMLDIWLSNQKYSAYGSYFLAPYLNLVYIAVLDVNIMIELR